VTNCIIIANKITITDMSVANSIIGGQSLHVSSLFLVPHQMRLDQYCSIKHF